MSSLTQLVIFSLDELLYGLPLRQVERIVRAAEVTRLPGAPDIVLGVINIAGQVVPVLNIRRRFDLKAKDIHPAEQFLIARTHHRSVAVVIDEAKNVIEVPTAEIISATEIVPNSGQICGVAKLKDGLLVIHDIDTFLSLDEEKALDQAMIAEAPDER